jgi:mono/diheme cytochrome c family protein
MKKMKEVIFALSICAITGIICFGGGSYSNNPFAAFPNKLLVPDTGKGFVPKPSKAQITVNEDTHEFGNIEQNTKVQTTFIIGNTGYDTLIIYGAQPSCGCTAAVQGKKLIPPGDTSHLFIQFDPHNKAEGEVTKTITITSNSRDTSKKVIRIHGTIFGAKFSHRATMHLDGLFEGDCASCHVQRGRGELGINLYEADCGICHGSKADNKPGPDITDKKMMDHTPSQWNAIISEGIANTNMPAFSSKHKGPLQDEEIASLVDFMSSYKRDLARVKKLHSGFSGSESGSTSNH